MLGCKVIATASSDEKRRICKEKGRADEAVDYTKEGWQKEVVRITGGKGVDVVYDPVGECCPFLTGDQADNDGGIGMIVPSLRCVAISARLLVVGFAGGTIEKVGPKGSPSRHRVVAYIHNTSDTSEPAPLEASLCHRRSLGCHSHSYQTSLMRLSVQDPQHAKGIVADILNHLASGTLVPVIYEPIYDGLENVSRGLVDLDNRKVWGKAVVRVRQGEGEGVRARL